MPIGKYIADFACPAARIVIELDGGQHGTDQAEMHDRNRTSAITESGYRVIRFWNQEVFEELDDVIARIWDELYAASPTLPSPQEGRETSTWPTLHRRGGRPAKTPASSRP
ncbi:MAG TPA: endonuclease domain-containing protein [Candidatus Dormibacteraeota bacterium]